MTMYREATVADRRSRLGFQTWVVPVEPTDRICDVHSTKMGKGDTLCWEGGMEHSIPCRVVDVVRMGVPA